MFQSRFRSICDRFSYDFRSFSRSFAERFSIVVALLRASSEVRFVPLQAVFGRCRASVASRALLQQTTSKIDRKSIENPSQSVQTTIAKIDRFFIEKSMENQCENGRWRTTFAKRGKRASRTRPGACLGRSGAVRERSGPSRERPGSAPDASRARFSSSRGRSDGVPGAPVSTWGAQDVPRSTFERF